MKYYHITSPEKWEKISCEGLKCGSDGYIYLLNTLFPAVVECVAFNQVFFNYVDFVLIEISKEGVLCPIEIDQVAEITRYFNHQFRIAQNLVSCDYLRLNRRGKLTEQSVHASIEFLMERIPKVVRS